MTLHASPSHGYVCFLYYWNDLLVLELSPFLRSKIPVKYTRQWIWYCIVGYIGNINILFSLAHLLNYCGIPVQERWGITIFELSFVSSKTALSSKTATSGTLYMKIYNCLIYCWYTRLPLSKFIIAENESCSLLLAI